MIGCLPTSLQIGDIEYPIETDFRNVLIVLAACADPDYTEKEKLWILMRRIFRDGFYEIPPEYMEEALQKAKWFLDCGQEEDNRKPPIKVLDWEQDEPIIFPAVNKIAGMETRSQEYIHWWTFMGYFSEIEEGTLSVVLGIRQKKAKGKKLEKWEREFYRNNKKLCDLKRRYTAEEQAEIDYWKKKLSKGRGV